MAQDTEGIDRVAITVALDVTLGEAANVWLEAANVTQYPERVYGIDIEIAVGVAE